MSSTLQAKKMKSYRSLIKKSIRQKPISQLKLNLRTNSQKAKTRKQETCVKQRKIKKRIFGSIWGKKKQTEKVKLLKRKENKANAKNRKSNYFSQGKQKRKIKHRFEKSKINADNKNLVNSQITVLKKHKKSLISKKVTNQNITKKMKSKNKFKIRNKNFCKRILGSQLQRQKEKPSQIFRFDDFYSKVN